MTNFKVGDTVKNVYNNIGIIVALFNDVYYDPYTPNTHFHMPSAVVHYKEAKQSWVEKLSRLTKINAPKFEKGEKLQRIYRKRGFSEGIFEVLHVHKDDQDKFSYILRKKWNTPTIPEYEMIYDIMVYDIEIDLFEKANKNSIEE